MQKGFCPVKTVKVHLSHSVGNVLAVTVCPVLYSEEDRNRLYLQKMVSMFGYILLTASDEPAPARPFFPINMVVAAILSTPGQSPHENRYILFSQVDSSPGYLALLEAGC